MRVIWLVVLLLAGCSLRQNVIFENGCDCTTEVYIDKQGFVPVKAREINLKFYLGNFSSYQNPNTDKERLEYKIRQKGVIYQYDLDSRQFDHYAFARKYMKQKGFTHNEYRYRVDGRGQLFILDKDGDWNALTEIGYTLHTSKQAK